MLAAMTTGRFRHGRVLGWLLGFLSIACALAAPTSGQTVPPPAPPTAIGSRLNLDLLSDDETTLFVSLLPGVWLNAPKTGTQPPGGALIDLLRQSERHLDNGARGLWRMLSDSGVIRAGLALWPTESLGGKARQVWMIGFETVSSISAQRLVDLLLKETELSPESVRETSYQGIRVLHLSPPGNTLHLAVDENRVVFSSTERLLEGYLIGLQDPPSDVERPPSALSIRWKPNWDQGDSSPFLSLFRRGLGADSLALRADRDDERIRLVVEVQRLPGLVPPLGPAQPLDTRLLSSIPKNSDLVLVSGGVSSPSSEGVPFSRAPGWTRLLGEPFAFGADIRSETRFGGSPVQVSGVFRDPDQIYLQQEDPVSGFIRERLSPEPPEATQWEWGGLTLDRLSRQDWVFLGNTQDLLGMEEAAQLVGGFPSLHEDAPPVVAGKLGTPVLWGPLVHFFATLPPDGQEALSPFVPFLQSQLDTVDFSLFEDPDRWRVVLESSHLEVAGVALLDFFVAVDIISIGGPSSLVDTLTNGMKPTVFGKNIVTIEQQ